MNKDLKNIYIRILKLGCKVNDIYKYRGRYYVTLVSDHWPYYNFINIINRDYSIYS